MGMGGWALTKINNRPFRATNMPLPPPPNLTPLLFLVKTRFKRVAVGFMAKEAYVIVLSVFITLNILTGASPVLFVTFQRLISSRGTFWPVLIVPFSLRLCKIYFAQRYCLHMKSYHAMLTAGIPLLSRHLLIPPEGDRKYQCYL